MNFIAVHEHPLIVYLHVLSDLLLLFPQSSKSSESRFHEKFVQTADISVANTPINYVQTTKHQIPSLANIEM